MALQKNKMTVEGDTYEIAQAHDAQFKANSDDKDTGNSITWTESEPLENEELNSSIFNKMSKMFSNVRYLYNELGVSGTSTGSSISIKKKLDDIENGKANVSHDHIKSTYKEIAAELPVINWQENRSDKVPTASLIPPMQAVINDVIIPNLNSAQAKYDAIFKNPANERYRGKDLGVWSKVSDVDTFCNNHNSANGYKGLCLGDYVTIMDGTYNAQWMIAGFDIFTTENGNYTENSYKGITWIPKTILTTGRMNPTNTTDGCYMGSEMYQTTLPAIAEKLKVVLGDHLLYRWVGVSTGTFESNNTVAARAYLTCPTEIELSGTMICGKRRDCGENVSQLPVFKYTKWAQGYSFWTRTPTSTTTWAVDHAGNGVLDDVLASQIDNIRPIMFLKP